MSASLLRGRSLRDQAGRSRRRLTRAAFYIHLWLGVLSTIALIAISITAAALPLERLAYAALEAAPVESRPGWQDGDAVDIGLIDRMDVRPRDGVVKVRLRDKASVEVTVDLGTGEVLHVGR